MREKNLATLLLATIVLIALHSMLVVAASPSLSYVYSFDNKGIARVTVIVNGLTGLLEYSFPVYEQVVNESLIAFDENGNVVLADYNGTHITIYPYNTTDKVIVQFNAIPSTIENDIITVTIHPYGPATIILPDNAGLLYFNDTPQIEIIGETIKLYYNESGGYEIQYIVVNATTTTQTTTTTTPTTTATTTTTTSPIQTTTTSPTTTITTTQTTTTSPTTTTLTTSPTTTSTQPTKTTTTSPQPITQTTTKSSTTTSSPTSTSSPITTTTQTTTTTTTPTTTTLKQATTTPITTTPSTSIQTTTTRGGGTGFPTIVVVFIAVIIVLLVIGYILYKIRFSKTMGETSTQEQERRHGGGGETSIVMEEPGAIDERDKLLLEKIAVKPMTISELARETGLSKSTVWRRIRKLEKEGYVKTREEGKYIYIEITDKGKQVLGT